MASGVACGQLLASRPLHILTVGGARGFTSTLLVRAAVERGHRVSVLTRSLPTALDAVRLPDGVELLVGQRPGDLSALTGRRWDVVVDFAAFAPDEVTQLTSAVDIRDTHYVLISTIMTYAPSHELIDEGSPVLEAPDLSMVPATADWLRYGRGKVLAERRAEALGVPLLIVRPGVIVGPGDPAHHLEYWYQRWNVGEEIVVPGSPSDPVQFVDSRDLATWLLTMIERGRTGVFNAVGPAESVTMGDLIKAIGQHLGERPVSWIPTEWLTRRGVKSDGTPFFWAKPHDQRQSDEFWISYRISDAKARAEGLVSRPLSDTVRDSLAAFRALLEAVRTDNRGGWAIDDLSLLAEWRQSNVHLKSGK